MSNKPEDLRLLTASLPLFSSLAENDGPCDGHSMEFVYIEKRCRSNTTKYREIRALKGFFLARVSLMARRLRS